MFLPTSKYKIIHKIILSLEIVVFSSEIAFEYYNYMLHQVGAVAQFIKGMGASNFSFSHQSRQFESWQMQLFFKKKYWYLHDFFLFIAQQFYVQFNNINNTQTNKMFDLESYSFTGFLSPNYLFWPSFVCLFLFPLYISEEKTYSITIYKIIDKTEK